MAIELEFVLPFSPDAVWSVVGDPGRVDWVSGVESCEYDGDVRRFAMRGAGRLSERILMRDPARRRLEYSVIESSPPLAAHLATMQIDAHADGALLTWTTEVDPPAVEPFIRQRMIAAIEQLSQVLTSQDA